MFFWVFYDACCWFCSFLYNIYLYCRIYEKILEYDSRTSDFSEFKDKPSNVDWDDHSIKILRKKIPSNKNYKGSNLHIFLLFIPYRLSNLSGLIELSFLQFIIFSFVLTPFCSETPYFKHIPINKHFTVLATTFGISTALANATISFSTIPLVNIFGYYAMWIIFMPIILCCYFSLNYLKTLEIKSGRYHNYPHEDRPYEDTAINE